MSGCSGPLSTVWFEPSTWPRSHGSPGLMRLPQRASRPRRGARRVAVSAPPTVREVFWVLHEAEGREVGCSASGRRLPYPMIPRLPRRPAPPSDWPSLWSRGLSRSCRKLLSRHLSRGRESRRTSACPPLAGPLGLPSLMWRLLSSSSSQRFHLSSTQELSRAPSFSLQRLSACSCANGSRGPSS